MSKSSYALSQFASKEYLHAWAKKTMDAFPALNEIMTESRLRGLGIELLIEATADLEKSLPSK